MRTGRAPRPHPDTAPGRDVDQAPSVARKDPGVVLAQQLDVDHRLRRHDDRPSDSAWAAFGTTNNASTLGHTIGPLPNRRMRSSRSVSHTTRRRSRTQQGTLVHATGDFQDPLRGLLFSPRPRFRAQDVASTVPWCDTSTRRSSAPRPRSGVDDCLDRRRHGLGVGLGEKPDVTEVETEHRHPRRTGGTPRRAGKCVAPNTRTISAPWPRCRRRAPGSPRRRIRPRTPRRRASARRSRPPAAGAAAVRGHARDLVAERVRDDQHRPHGLASVHHGLDLGLVHGLIIA